MENDDIFKLACSVCDEFCDTVLNDPETQSILLYVNRDYYPQICSRLTKLGFIEIFKNKQDKNTVVVFQLVYDEDIEMIFEDDDEDESLFD